MSVAVALGDIRGGTAGDWLVIGWFTPDYRPLAEKLAANLTAHGAPYHLFAKPKLDAGWNTSRKPTVVLEAMDAYPGKTVVLMDVDCIVRGDIEPVTRVDGDVGITVIAQNVKGTPGRRLRRGRDAEWRHWIGVECSSRVVVFRPTSGARLFAQRWAEQVKHSEGISHDEHAMVWAFLGCQDVVDFRYIDRMYSGREISDLPDAVVCHASAHSAGKAGNRGRLKTALRSIERRWFRSGRTRTQKQQFQLGAPA
jgi:hypothetical protein